MFVTIYSPGGLTLSGNFRATFQNLAAADPAPIAGDVSGSIADSSIVIHASSYDPSSKIYTVPFSIQSGSLDGSHLTIGLYLALGITTENLKLLTIDKEIPIPVDALAVVAGLIVLYLILR